MCGVGIVSALASLITHYTDKGKDEFGCTRTTGKTAQGGEPFSNMMCSREIAACSFIGPLYHNPKAADTKAIKGWAVDLACNEAVSFGSRKGLR